MIQRPQHQSPGPYPFGYSVLVSNVWLLLFFAIIYKRKVKIKNPASLSFSAKFVLHAHIKIIASSAPQSPNNFLLKNIFFFKPSSSKVEKYLVLLAVISSLGSCRLNYLCSRTRSAGKTKQCGNGRQRYKLNVSRKWSSAIEAHNLI